VQRRWYGENCAPHNVCTNDEVKAGGVCAGSAVGFIVYARDQGTHIMSE